MKHFFISNYTMSKRELSPSFVFVLISSNVPIRLSNTFFWTCIPSIASRMSNSFQYGKYSKKMDFFLNVAPGVGLTSFLGCPSFVFFPNTKLMLLTILKTLWPLLLPDGASEFLHHYCRSTYPPFLGSTCALLIRSVYASCILFS